MNRPGLRERKRLETLHRIQEEALRLFDEQGYDATTIEQIAEAAGVSPSTFYRYFPVKEDVVVQDEYDPYIMELFQSLPKDMPPFAVIRALFADLFSQFSAEDADRIRRRAKMIYAVPALRARQHEQSRVTESFIGVMAAERTGRSEDDLEVRNFSAVVVAAMTAAVIAWTESDSRDDLTAVVSRCLDHLEAGLPL